MSLSRLVEPLRLFHPARLNIPKIIRNGSVATALIASVWMAERAELRNVYAMIILQQDNSVAIFNCILGWPNFLYVEFYISAFVN